MTASQVNYNAEHRSLCDRHYKDFYGSTTLHCYDYAILGCGKICPFVKKPKPNTVSLIKNEAIVIMP